MHAQPAPQLDLAADGGWRVDRHGRGAITAAADGLGGTFPALAGRRHTLMEFGRPYWRSGVAYSDLVSRWAKSDRSGQPCGHRPEAGELRLLAPEAAALGEAGATWRRKKMTMNRTRRHGTRCVRVTGGGRADAAGPSVKNAGTIVHFSTPNYGVIFVRGGGAGRAYSGALAGLRSWQKTSALWWRNARI